MTTLLFSLTHTHTQPFNGLWSGTTRVGRYQKKHSPTHSHPGHWTSFINFLHLLHYIASFLFSLCAWQSFYWQPVSRSSLFQLVQFNSPFFVLPVYSWLKALKLTHGHWTWLQEGTLETTCFMPPKVEQRAVCNFQEVSHSVLKMARIVDFLWWWRLQLWKHLVNEQCGQECKEHINGWDIAVGYQWELEFVVFSAVCVPVRCVWEQNWARKENFICVDSILMLFTSSVALTV